MKKISKEKGFTLIEMVIVITIIGILSSIAVAKYSKVQENAKKNADYATAANLATAAMISISDGNTEVSPESLSSGGYIQFVPKSKSSKGKPFVIAADGDNVTVTIDGVTFYPKPNDTVVNDTETNK
ncbi:competence type IV pilus major pilin ComGC [Terrisporobacter sp.]